MIESTFDRGFRAGMAKAAELAGLSASACRASGVGGKWQFAAGALDAISHELAALSLPAQPKLTETIKDPESDTREPIP